jgi:hypothetical protein
MKASGAAGATLALGGWSGLARAATARTEVAVIGSGMAGLAAASALAADGYDVVVLEGRERIGGRTFTSDAIGTPVDLGAAWIHGPRGNPLTKLAKRAGARLVETDNDAETLAGAADPDRADREAERLIAGLERLKGRLRSDVSIAQGLERLGAPPDSLDPAVRFAFDTQFEEELGGDLGTLSLAALDEDEELPGGDLLVLSGYSKLVRVLARGLDVRTGHVVSRVARSRGGLVITTSGGAVRCDRAVVTLPIGVLKSGTVRFDPGLPTAKRRAIKRLRRRAGQGGAALRGAVLAGLALAGRAAGHRQPDLRVPERARARRAAAGGRLRVRIAGASARDAVRRRRRGHRARRAGASHGSRRRAAAGGVADHALGQRPVRAVLLLERRRGRVARRLRHAGRAGRPAALRGRGHQLRVPGHGPRRVPVRPPGRTRDPGRIARGVVRVRQFAAVRLI